MVKEPKHSNFFAGLEQLLLTPIRVEESKAGELIIDSIKLYIEQRSRVGSLLKNNDVPLVYFNNAENNQDNVDDQEDSDDSSDD